jgi:hypothetical protein
MATGNLAQAFRRIGVSYREEGRYRGRFPRRLSGGELQVTEKFCTWSMGTRPESSRMVAIEWRSKCG